jgi:hypothetical protein
VDPTYRETCISYRYIFQDAVSILYDVYTASHLITCVKYERKNTKDIRGYQTGIMTLCSKATPPPQLLVKHIKKPHTQTQKLKRKLFSIMNRDIKRTDESQNALTALRVQFCFNSSPNTQTNVAQLNIIYRRSQSYTSS